MAKSYYLELDIDKVQPDIDNPRIKTFTEHYVNPNETQMTLALMSGATDSKTTFDSLYESIKVNGQIINPIIVNHITSEDKYIVIEGNTRLAIYHKLFSSTKDKIWKTIRCIVYDDLPQAGIDAIRLQSHLVGPRDWNAYSKAKYLHTLLEVQRMPESEVIAYCGGNATDIKKFVAGYNDMQEYYMTEIDRRGLEPEYDQFSKFAELQNKSVLNALAFSNYTKTDFANWVINKNIDNAQNVRKLPLILKTPAAKEEFLKTNITKAIQVVGLQNPTNNNLKNYDYDELAIALIEKLDNISKKEADFLKTEEGEAKRGHLESLIRSICSALDLEKEDVINLVESN